MKFILDASVFIEASRTYYAFDIVPTFWEWLSTMNRADVIYSGPP